MFQEFPYTNFHELNLDWIVKIAKDFLDQYTHIQEVIQTGLEDLTESRETGLAELDQKRLDSLAELNQKTLDGLSDLQDKYDTLNGLLQAWYDTHSADIAGQLAAAITAFNTAAETKSQALLDSWPADYSELVTEYNNLKLAISDEKGNVILSDTLKSAIENSMTNVNIQALEFVADNKKVTVSNGELVLANATGFKVYRMPSDNVSKITVTLNQNMSAWVYVAAVADSQGNVTDDSEGRHRYLLRKTTDDGSQLNVAEFTPVSGGYVYITYISTDYYDSISCLNYEKITSSYKDEIEDIIEENEAVKDLEEQTAKLEAQSNNTLFLQKISEMELVEVNRTFTINNGVLELTSSSSTGSAVYRMPSDNITKIGVTLKTAAALWIYTAAIVDSELNVNNNEYLLCKQAGTYTKDIEPVSGGYLYVNLWGYATVPNTWYDNIQFIDYKKISDSYKAEIKEISKEGYFEITKYRTMVRKPFNFSGKAINFTGDSITAGYIDGTHKTETHNYPLLFSTAVGATHYNTAVSGACFGPVQGKSHIIDQVSATDKTHDILFIAAGINDWVLGVELSTFKTAVKAVCDYLNDAQNNFQDKPVIWITPINQAGWEDDHVVNQKGSVEDYRNIMTRVIIENDTYMRFSIIQGKEFSFPTKYDDATYIGLMFGDKLHPSELGYKTAYTTGVLNALC